MERGRHLGPLYSQIQDANIFGRWKDQYMWMLNVCCSGVTSHDHPTSGEEADTESALADEVGS